MIRDRKYLDHLRTERCVISGRRGDDSESVDPAHIGTAGRGVKIDDDCALPITHSIHAQMHAQGEMKIFRAIMPDWLLREALRAYARQLYREWKDG